MSKEDLKTMKCTNCGQTNKEAAKVCKKCGFDMTLPPSWFPDWKWHARTLAIIYTLLIVVFFSVRTVLHKLPPPYHMREIPPQMTPWLNPEHKEAP